MCKEEKTDKELRDIFKLFFDAEPVSFRISDSSRSESDVRKTVIADADNGKKYVIKLADNDFTFPGKIKMWQRTAKEYQALGYYCPEIYCDKKGGFPSVSYDGHIYTAYAEGYAGYPSAEDRAKSEDGKDNPLYEGYKKDIWIMTAKAAAKYFNYTEYPSGYCLFERFCPSDKNDEVLDEALNWKEYAGTLPPELTGQAERIWALWTENRAALEPVYKKLPTSVFQADLNSTNILIDDSGKFAGIFDFNLSGKDVFLNYLMRENFDSDFETEIDMIRFALGTASGYYKFSDVEKDAALMLYRCLKPLWCNKLSQLKKLEGSVRKTKAYLDKTEYYLTAPIDFKAYMG